MLFYLPGSFLGAIFSDIIGPKYCIVVGTTIQAVIGLLLGIFYEKLTHNIAAFVAVYGLFLTFGEFGLGDNIGLMAAKSSATCVRGRFYGMAAAMGKIGAFIGTFVFPLVISISFTFLFTNQLNRLYERLEARIPFEEKQVHATSHVDLPLLPL
jgi:MFS family permease